MCSKNVLDKISQLNKGKSFRLIYCLDGHINRAIRAGEEQPAAATYGEAMSLFQIIRIGDIANALKNTIILGD